jgi:hypothetical protein
LSKDPHILFFSKSEIGGSMSVEAGRVEDQVFDLPIVSRLLSLYEGEQVDDSRGQMSLPGKNLAPSLNNNLRARYIPPEILRLQRVA